MVIFHHDCVVLRFFISIVLSVEAVGIVIVAVTHRVFGIIVMLLENMRVVVDGIIGRVFVNRLIHSAMSGARHARKMLNTASTTGAVITIHCSRIVAKVAL
jgi:hypothetical protein